MPGIHCPGPLLCSCCRLGTCLSHHSVLRLLALQPGSTVTGHWWQQHSCTLDCPNHTFSSNPNLAISTLPKPELCIPPKPYCVYPPRRRRVCLACWPEPAQAAWGRSLVNPRLRRSFRQSVKQLRQQQQLRRRHELLLKQRQHTQHSLESLRMSHLLGELQLRLRPCWGPLLNPLPTTDTCTSCYAVTRTKAGTVTATHAKLPKRGCCCSAKALLLRVTVDVNHFGLCSTGPIPTGQKHCVWTAAQLFNGISPQGMMWGGHNNFIK
eukprot:GHUV01035357.1.p1 GENE.GHUV01035357.1~~GHUV01035357.1.p1  ORF type:complete len:266 (-),score=12.26 GHUV01035357.1:305-1102(-)